MGNEIKKNLDLPFDVFGAKKIADSFGSPVYIYDEKGLRKTARALNKAFSWAKNYKNYFAVKATPTPGIMKILHEEGMGFDCSSRSELEIVKRMGIVGPDIFYTSNNTPVEDFELAIDLQATITLDDISHVPNFLHALKKDTSLHRIAARYNPGSLKHGNAIIGEPTEAKYGMDIPALIQVFRKISNLGIDEFGLHTMVASNELGESYFADTTSILLDAVEKIEAATNVRISFINIGGGFGLNYLPTQPPFDAEAAATQIKKVLEKRGRSDLELVTENGRYVTGPHGYLLCTARYEMEKYKTYVGVDASMNDLMRPGMYGAYHHITVMGAKKGVPKRIYDVVGSLCENNDKFAINRTLPMIKTGDLLVIHDVGAHGHAMGFNYNGLLRPPEVLLSINGDVQLVRKRETVDDYLRNIIWD